MKASPRAFAVGACLTAVLAGAAVWSMAFRPPSPHLLALPEGLIAIDTSTGQGLLADSAFVADYAGLSSHFEAQARPAFCGVASSVVVLNALRASGPAVTQSTFFTDAVSDVRSSLRVTFGGMSLPQLVDVLRAQGLDARAYYASDTSVNTFRTMARENLKTAGDYLIVNYDRAKLGQTEGGHFSPVAAYSAASDRLLILDVAAYKYPPVWVSTEALWNAMNTVDSASERTRGFAVVREPGERETFPPAEEAP